MHNHPLFQLVLLRYREFIREPEAVFWNFAFPILLVAGLGAAFRTQPPELVHIAVVTPQLAQSLRKDKLLAVEELSPEAALAALRTNKVTLIAEPGPNDSVIFRYDDTNPDARNARQLTDHAIQVAAGRKDPVPVSENFMREPGSRYIDFLVPGMVGMGLMNGGMWGLVFSIVDTRRRKLLKRIVATPMPRHYYLLSFLYWRLLLLPLEVGIPVVFGALIFGVPLRGSLIELAFLCLLGALTFGSIGLLISSRARTIEAATGIMNLVQLPMWILSGVFFSAQRFPEAAQPFIKALPLTALNDALRAQHAARHGTAAIGAATRRAGCLPRRIVYAGAKNVSLALIRRRRCRRSFTKERVVVGNIRLGLQRFDRFGAHLRTQRLLDFAAHGFERLGSAGFDQNQVIAKRSFDGLAQLAHRQFERDLIELFHHLARTKRTQIAAVFARAYIIRFGFREIGKLRTRYKFRADFFGLRERFFIRQVLLAIAGRHA